MSARRRRVRPQHLLLAWAAYWLALILVTLGPALLLAWRITRPGPGHGEVNASVGDAGVSLTIVRDGVTAWTGTASLGELAFWIAVPPMLLWLVWLASRPRPARVELPDEKPGVAPGAAPRAELAAPRPDEWPAPPRAADPVRRDERTDRAD